MLQFLAFCGIGMANTLLGLASIFALKFFCGASDLLANAAGYSAGIVLSFFANKILTFAHRSGYLRAAGRFMLVQVAAYAVNLLTVLALLHAGVNSYLSQTLGIIPYSLCGFVGAKYFAFADGAALRGPPAGER